MDCGKSGAIPRAAPRGARALSVRPSPRHRGTQDQEQSTSRFCGRDCRAVLLFPGPSRPRRAGAGKARRGARRMRARSLPVHGRTVSEPRSLLAKSRGHGCPRDRGREGAFLLVTSLWASKEK